MFKAIRNFIRAVWRSIKGALLVIWSFLKHFVKLFKLIRDIVHMIYELFIIAFVVVLCFAGYKVYLARNVLSNKVDQISRTINGLTGSLSKIGEVADTGKALAKTGDKVGEAAGSIGKKIKGLF